MDGTELADLTNPMSEPFPDVIQDLWQLSHVTASYVGRAAAGGLLLATGIVDNNGIAIVVAALFLPFLAEVLAVSFGLWCHNRHLIPHRVCALVTSALLAFLGGLIVAAFMGGPIRFRDFKSPLPSFAISALIGITAGLPNADDTGRRYLIGAAVQRAIFPYWLGAAVIVGSPPRHILDQRLLSFAINLVTISASAVVSYSALHFRRARRWRAPLTRRYRVEAPSANKAHYDFFLGIFAPDRRASLSAMATACLRLFTFLPLPDFSFPCFFSFMTLWIVRFPREPPRELCEWDDFVAIVFSF